MDGRLLKIGNKYDNQQIYWNSNQSADYKLIKCKICRFIRLITEWDADHWTFDGRINELWILKLKIHSQLMYDLVRRSEKANNDRKRRREEKIIGEVDSKEAAADKHWFFTELVLF